MLPLSPTLVPPYYAVIFTSVRADTDQAEYDRMNAVLDEKSKDQSGFLGILSLRNAEGVGITVSYWESVEAIRLWGLDPDHTEAKRNGRKRWYSSFRVEICKVEQVRFHEA
jgi:heme-degrading monooxygenase HmoA